eukprot:12112170-Karenia_brevis.AAC.1
MAKGKQAKTLTSTGIPAGKAKAEARGKSMPRMIDSFSTLGECRTGFLPQLLPVLGVGSFDDAPEARWFSHLL